MTTTIGIKNLVLNFIPQISAHWEIVNSRSGMMSFNIIEYWLTLPIVAT